MPDPVGHFTARVVRAVRQFVSLNAAVTSCYLLCLWAAFMGAVADYWLGWTTASVLLYSESLALAAVPFLTAADRGRAVRAQIICLVHGIICALLVLLSGGTTSPLFVWMLLVPVTGHVCGTPKVSSICAAVTGLWGAMLFVVPTAWIPGDMHTPQQMSALASYGPMGGITLTILLGLLAAMQQHAEQTYREALVDELRQREASRRDFISKMSHELRTPLTAILGYAEDLAPAGKQACSETRSAATIRRNSRALLASLDDLLEWEQLESGELPLRVTPCTTVRIFSEIQAALADMPCPQVPRVSVEYAGDIPERISTDWVLLQKAVLKTAAAALQATGRGGIRLHVRFHSDPPRLEILVLPLGHSWEREELQKLFETSRFVPSVAGGFSLAMARGLARLLGGDVQLVVTDKPQTAGLQLSAGFAAVPDASWLPPHEAVPVERDTVGPRARAARVEDCRILLVEDSADTRALMTFLLTRAGAEVHTVDNGQAAITAALASEAKQTPFDVVLMDMQLPLLDGREATMRLRAEGYARPIIAFTAQSVQFTREKCLASGCDDYITKPFRSHEIIELVARHARRNLDALMKS